LIRDFLDKGLAEHRLGDKTKHLRGRLNLSQKSDDSWRREIKDRNWRR